MDSRVRRRVTEYWRIAVFLPIIAVFMVQYRFWGTNYRYAHLAAFSDDLFYYLQVARHVLDQGRSSFDGLTLTNGYHPLWMAIILVLGKLCGGLNEVFFGWFRVLLGVLSMASGVLLWRLCRNINGNLRQSTVVFVCFYYMIIRLTFEGMEVALTIPLMLAFTLSLFEREHDLTVPEALWQSFLGGAVILSRIDALIFVGPALVTAIFARGTFGRRLGLCVASLSVASLMVGAYFAWNQYAFASWLPLSGVAKGLKTSGAPSERVAESLFQPQRLHQLFLAFLPIMTVLLGGIVWLARGVPWVGRQRWVIGWTLAFPCLYYTILTFRSDWPLWGWYYYPLPIAGAVGLKLLADLLPGRLGPVWEQRILALGLIAATAYIGVSLSRIAKLTPADSGCYRTALGVTEFAKTHPGLYAMGDQAGLTAFVSGVRMIHVEGLVGDRRMVEHIRRQDDLLKVLKSYGVDYYVTVQDLERRGESYVAREPAQAGRLSAKMTGVFRSPPLFQASCSPSATWKVFEVGHAP